LRWLSKLFFKEVIGLLDLFQESFAIISLQTVSLGLFGDGAAEFRIGIEKLESVAPSLRVGAEEAGFAGFDSVAEGVGRRGESGDFDDGGFEELELAFTVSEVAFYQRGEVEVGGGDVFLELQIISRGLLDDAFRGEERAGGTREAHIADDEEASVGVGGEEVKESGKNEGEVSLVGRGAGEVAEGEGGFLGFLQQKFSGDGELVGVERVGNDGNRLFKAPL